MTRLGPLGVRSDVACPADSEGCLVKKPGPMNAVDVVPSPEGEGSNDFEGSTGKRDKNEEDGREKEEWPEGMNEDPGSDGSDHQ